MLHTIKNDYLSVRIDTLGAQLQSIRSVSETEYLWQGDEKYWEKRSPLLFPYVARLYGCGYTLHGRKYEMGIHGFATQSEFKTREARPASLTMILRESDETLRQYPFTFTLAVTYSLCGETLEVKYTVENRDRMPMPFGIGGHPGFNVPFEKESEFSDYTLTFSEACTPDRLGFTQENFLSGVNKPYPLEKRKVLRLSHSLFDEDAIVLQNMARSVTLASEKSRKKLTVSYPDMPYLGIWHMPKTDAPYVCIEPWSSLPSRQGVVEELSCKSDLLTVRPGEKFETQWEITITED